MLYQVKNKMLMRTQNQIIFLTIETIFMTHLIGTHRGSIFLENGNTFQKWKIFFFFLTASLILNCTQ